MPKRRIGSLRGREGPAGAVFQVKIKSGSPLDVGGEPSYNQRRKRALPIDAVLGYELGRFLFIEDRLKDELAKHPNYNPETTLDRLTHDIIMRKLGMI